MEAVAGGRVEILGVPVDCFDMPETLARLEQFVASGRPHVVATADASGIAQAQTDPVLMANYRTADLVTPDSSGVIWALRRKGARLSGRVSGVDLLDRVCALSAERGYSVFLLGAAEGVAAEAADRLRLRHPGCRIVGAHHGYFGP